MCGDMGLNVWRPTYEHEQRRHIVEAFAMEWGHWESRLGSQDFALPWIYIEVR